MSHEFLSGQTAELNKKVKDLQGKVKKSPDDLKAQLKAFMAVSWSVSWCPCVCPGDPVQYELCVSWCPCVCPDDPVQWMLGCHVLVQCWCSGDAVLVQW